jgi:hypothetical protein
MMTTIQRLAFALAAAAGAAHAATPAGAPAAVLQLYTYRIKDRPKFEQGYRDHLSWHVRQGDKLVWYAWTVQSGLRRGLFIDGTAGAAFAALDARPDPAADAADFARTAAPYSEPVNVETWELWKAGSTAMPLEELKPTRTVDVFHVRVLPRDEYAFERGVAALASRPSGSPLKLTWYRQLRGGAVPAYMLMVARDRWADIEQGSGTFRTTLATAYGASAADLAPVMNSVSAVDVETWTYAPRLSLMPGAALAE